MTRPPTDAAGQAAGSEVPALRRPSTRARVGGALSGLALLLAGCGGASASAGFVAQANAICANTNKQLGALATPGSGTSGLAHLVASEIPIDEAELRRLATVAPPAGERESYAAALANARDDVALLARILAALRSGNTTALNVVTEESSAVSRVAVAAMKRLHLRQCARNL